MLKAIKKAALGGTALVTLATTCGPVFANLEAANKRGVERKHTKNRLFAEQYGMSDANLTVYDEASKIETADYSQIEARAAANYGLNLVRDEAHYMK